MIHPDELLKYQIILSQLPGIGPVLARALVSYCGGVEDIFRWKKSRLEKIPGIGPERAGWIAGHSLDRTAEEEAAFIRKNGITPLFYSDNFFPRRLRHCDDAPVLLFQKGNVDLNAGKLIAIVGTRYITGYGKELTENLVEGLVTYNPVIVSGLAYGVDVHAHKSALYYGLNTLGVLAHGLDRIYPAVHKGISGKMLQQGGLVTEYISGTIPDRENFPERNRIVAGLCDAVVVVESALKGGALITAELATGYNRDVFAFPGRVSDSFSRGCNALIELNKAMLVTGAADIARAMNWDLSVHQERKGQPAIQPELFATLEEEEKKVADMLKQSGSLPIDELAVRVKLPVSRVSAMLLKLEFLGMIKSLPGKVYCIC